MNKIENAVRILKNGGVAIFPTDSRVVVNEFCHPCSAVPADDQPREDSDQQQCRVGLPHGDGDLVGGYVFLVGIGLGEADVIGDLRRHEVALHRSQVAFTIAEAQLIRRDLPGELDVQVM